MPQRYCFFLTYANICAILLDFGRLYGFFLFDWLVKCKIFASMHRKNGLNRCVCKKKFVPLHAQM